MKCFKLIHSGYHHSFFITDLESDTYLYKYSMDEWRVGAPTWTNRSSWYDKSSLIEISPLEVLVCLGESPEEIVRRVTGQK